jgi:hypothetical protein
MLGYLNHEEKNHMLRTLKLKKTPITENLNNNLDKFIRLKNFDF